MRYKEEAEQFINVANTYNTLISDTYFEMTNSQITKPYFSNAAKGFEDLMIFLKQTQKMIINAKDGCPALPTLATFMVEVEKAKKEEKLQKAQAENSQATDVS